MQKILGCLLASDASVFKNRSLRLIHSSIFVMGRIAIIKRKVRSSRTFKKTGAIKGKLALKDVHPFIQVTESFRRLINISISGVNRQSRILNIQRNVFSSILLLSAKEEPFESLIVCCSNIGELTDRCISLFSFSF